MPLFCYLSLKFDFFSKRASELEQLRLAFAQQSSRPSFNLINFLSCQPLSSLANQEL